VCGLIGVCATEGERVVAVCFGGIVKGTVCVCVCVRVRVCCVCFFVCGVMTQVFC
jgi:hypothetical protein